MKSEKPLIIAIDGGAGTGTSTAAKGVSEALGVPHLNTGELYRGITFAVLDGGLNPLSADDCVRVTKLITFELEEGNVVAVNNKPVRGQLHHEPINSLVPTVASYPEVRDQILHFQRDYAKEHGAVMEGRDITTRIFPDATLKYFFICDPEERVRRVNAGGRKHETVQTLLERDKRDAGKTVGAFKQADDATVVDTTNMSVTEVVAFIVSQAREAGY